MLFEALSAAFYGIDANIIDVEVDLPGMKTDQDHFYTVGLPDAAVRESRDRVRAAIKNSGFDVPSTYITINLAPFDIKKKGSGFDLSMAIGILGAYGALQFLLVGELGLNGGLRSVSGMLPVAVAARARGIRNLGIPKANAREGAVVEGVNVYPVERLNEVCELLNAAANGGIHACLSASRRRSSSASSSTFLSTSLIFADSRPPSGLLKWPPPAAITSS
jgi:magnesium chelatase family protein